MKTEIAKQSQKERKQEQLADRRERRKELTNPAIRKPRKSAAECTTQLELEIIFEACEHVGHFAEELQKYVDLGLQRSLMFLNVEYSRGDDYMDSPYGRIVFGGVTPLTNDPFYQSVVDSFSVVGSMLEAGVNCNCEACESLRQKRREVFFAKEANAKAAAAGK
jgi:hypothetical protein